VTRNTLGGVIMLPGCWWGGVQRYLLFPCYGVGVCEGVNLRGVQVSLGMFVAITRGLLCPDEALSCGAIAIAPRPILIVIL